MAMEFSVEKPETKNDHPPVIRYAEEPVACRCSACGRDVESIVTSKHNWASVVLFGIMFLVLGLFALCVFPLISFIAEDTVHTCPVCGYQLGLAKKFRLPEMSKEIITLRCGSCALVLSKRYVFGFALTGAFILLLASLRWYVRAFGFPDLSEGPPTDATWETFLDQCGGRGSFGNPLHAAKVFETEYYGKTVGWQGRLNMVREGFFRKNFLFFNMYPHQKTRLMDPDLALMYNAAKFDDEVADLEVGDLVAFNATLIDLGNRQSPHLGILRGMRKVQSGRELPDLFESKGALQYLKLPPIAHVPDIARKMGQRRRQGGNQDLFYINDMIIGAQQVTGTAPAA